MSYDRTAHEIERYVENQVADLVCPYCDSPLLTLVEVALPPEEAEQVGQIAAKGAAGTFFGALGGGLIGGPAGAAIGAVIFGGGTVLAVHDNVSNPTAKLRCERCGEERYETVRIQ